MGGVGDIMTVMLVLAGAYILLKSGKLEEILGGNFQLQLPGLPTPGPAAPAPTPMPAAPTATPEPSEGGEGEEAGGGGGGEAPAPAAGGGGGGGGGGGATPTGTSCPSGTSCASSNGGSRNECDGISMKEYEATWCGDFSGDDLSIKTFGPNHSGSSCCWCILSVSPDGAFGIRHEGPHPSTSSKSGTTAAIGKPSCIKAIVRSGQGGINLEGWGLVGGSWKKAFSYSGECGDSQKSSTPASSQQVSFRCDGSLNTTCATVAPLGGGGGGGAAPAAPAEGGGGGGEEEAAAGGVRAYRRRYRQVGCGPKCRPRFDQLIAIRNRQNEFDRILGRF